MEVDSPLVHVIHISDEETKEEAQEEPSLSTSVEDEEQVSCHYHCIILREEAGSRDLLWRRQRQEVVPVAW